MDAADEIDLDVTGVAHGGVFVARREGRVVFVPDTMPGERVRVRVTDARKASFWRGEVVRVLDASPDRQPHVWAQAGLDHPAERRPGGADFGHIALARQRELKLQVVRDALTRIGRLDVPATIEAASPALVGDIGGDGAAHATETADASGWRTRVRLHVDADGNIGPYAARSHTVVTVDELPLAVPEIGLAASRLPAAPPGRIDLVRPSDGRVRVILRPDGAKAPDRSARERVVERVAGRAFGLDAGGFWQVHRLAASTLFGIVSEALRDAGGADPDAHHLDLYGGVGLFAAALGEAAGPAARITTVESDSRATEHARRNLSEWTGASAETGRVERWLERTVTGAGAAERDRLAAGIVVLDPPRSGVGVAATARVAELQPAAVVYVACDPVALARDLAAFREHGYEAQTVRAVDLFPHSHHVESVTVLRRTRPRR